MVRDSDVFIEVNNIFLMFIDYLHSASDAMYMHPFSSCLTVAVGGKHCHDSHFPESEEPKHKRISKFFNVTQLVEDEILEFSQ